MEKYCPKCFRKYPAEVEVCPADGSFLVSPHEKDLTGEVLDNRYTVLECIGRGGMGVVYRAEQHLIKRIVALKVLRREVVQDETAVKRFLTEARVIASLDSPYTVTLYDFGVTRNGLLYYTMELLKGEPLSRIIRKEAPLEVRRAARLVLQVCDSLKEAHERGVLHRDLKPDNLFVIKREGREAIKVVDFGIAKLVGESSVESVTRTGMIIGTPQYLSPEQALGNPVVPASDLYSLGIVFYEMLAGVPPFQDETPIKTLWCHLRDPLPPLRSKNPSVQVPRSIEAFLARALEKEPGRRFPTAVAFRDALKKALEDYDAAPETVSLPSLSTTDEGLRLKTQAWEEKAPGQARKPEPPGERGGRDETVLFESSVMTRDKGAGAVPPASPPVSPSISTADAQPSSKPVGVRDSASRIRESEFEPGPETRVVARVGQRRTALWAAGGGLVLLAVILAVWQPWSGTNGEVGIRSPEVTEALQGARKHDDEKAAAARGAKAEAARKEGVQKKAEEKAVAAKAENQKQKAEEITARQREKESGKAKQAGAVPPKIAEEEAAAQKEQEERRRAEEAQAARQGNQEKREAEELAAAKKADQEKGKVKETEAAITTFPLAEARSQQQEEARKTTLQVAEARLQQKEEALKKAKAEAAKKDQEKREAEEAAAAEKVEERKKKAEKRGAAKKTEAEKNKAQDKAAAEKAAAKKAEADKRNADQEIAAKRAEQEKRKPEEEAAAKKVDEERKKAEAQQKRLWLLKRGREAMSHGEFEKAIALFRQAKKAGDTEAADALIKECYESIRKRKLTTLVYEGNRAAWEKRWGDCVKYLEKAVKLGGGTSEVRKQLKKCREMMEF